MKFVGEGGLSARGQMAWRKKTEIERVQRPEMLRERRSCRYFVVKHSVWLLVTVKLHQIKQPFVTFSNFIVDVFLFYGET
jgi:ribosomal protein L15E